jgi:hypothetical protein
MIFIARIAVVLVTVAGICFGFRTTAFADTRVALVIGNSAYKSVARLTNPTSDAQAIADALKGLGFDTTLVLDQGREALQQSLRSFGSKARGADIAAVYYAGHGMEADGQNYLIPVDATLKSDADIDFELVPLDLVLRTVAGAKHLRLVMLDACRNNPFAAEMANSGGGRAVGRGLVRVEPANNTLVAYAAKAGTIADDGDGAHSPFATALLSNLGIPGQEVRLAFGKVRDDVLAATGNKQEPFVYGSLGGAPIYLLPNSGAEAPEAAAAKPDSGGDREALFWESIKDSTNPAMFEAYLKQYPGGVFAGLARAKLAELRPAQTAALTPEAQPPVPAIAAASEIEDMAATYVVLKSANLRAAPGTDAKVLGKLNADDIVSVTGKVKGKDWLRVRSGDKTGYASAKLLQQTDAEEAAAWQKLKQSPSQEAVEAFLKAYPSGTFRAKAEVLLGALQSESATANADSPAEESASAVLDSTASGKIMEADIARLPSDLRPDPKAVNAFNAASAMTAFPPPKAYRMKYRVTWVGHEDEGDVAFEREVSPLGVLRLTRESNTVKGEKGLNQSVDAGPLSLIADSSSEWSFVESSHAKIVMIEQVVGALFPLRVGNSLSFEYTSQNDSVTSDGPASKSVEEQVNYRVVAELACADVFPMVPGRCFRIDKTFSGSNTLLTMLFATAVNDFLKIELSSGDSVNRYTIESFSIQ